MPKNYTLIEHTADIGLKIRGRNLKELFKNSALAMFDIMAEKADKKTREKQKVELLQKAEDLEELFVNWLNELLSLSAIKESIFTDIKIKKLDKQNIEAELCCESAVNYRFKTEVKAATYHELGIKRDKSGWQARVIFDV